MGFKAEIKKLRARATLKIGRQPDFAAGYLKALDDIEDLYTDITTHSYHKQAQSSRQNR